MASYLDWPLEESPAVEVEYDRYAEIYDLLFGARGDDLEFYVRAAKELCAGGPVLELGTGTGRVAERLAEEGIAVVGVDVSRQMLAHAEPRQRRHEALLSFVHADVRTMQLGRRYSLVIAPFGMMAHLLSPADRLATMKRALEHLEPGGVFIFDDMPSWIAGEPDGDLLEVVKQVVDPSSGAAVRLKVMSIDIAHEPLTLCHHFIDWLDGKRLTRRLAVRVVFRNTPLEEELSLLAEAGFGHVELLGGFDARPFDRQSVSSNKRLILRCRREPR